MGQVNECNSVEKPEKKLVDLMEAETGVKMDAKMMRLFLKANWRKISLYAHAVHGSDECQ